MTDLELFHDIAARTRIARRPEARVLLLFWPEAEGEALESRLARHGVRTIGIYSARQLRLYLAHVSRRPNAAVDLIVRSPNAGPEDRELVARVLPDVPELTLSHASRDAMVQEVLGGLASTPDQLVAV